MKKLIFLLLIVFCFMLAGCRDSKTPTIEQPKTEPTVEVTPTPEKTSTPEVTPEKTPTTEVDPTPEVTPEKTPEETGPVNPTPEVGGPTLAVGYNDPGYNTVKNDATGVFTINKSASATQWEGAVIDIVDYTSAYSAFNLKFTTTNVTNFTVQLFFQGGEDDWSNYVSLYQVNLEDGEHEVYLDFTNLNPVSTLNWASVPGYFVKDYKVSGIVFSLDTAVDAANLVSEDATCVISELKFDKIGTDVTPTPKPEPTPTPEPTPDEDEPFVPSEKDPNAPTLSAGWNDSGYKTTENVNGEFVIDKAANAILWGCATLDLNNYTSVYSAFTIRFKTTGVKHLSIQLYVTGLEEGWTNYVAVYTGTIDDGEHEIYIDFSTVRPVNGSTWESVPGYFIKDYNVEGIKIALDTATENLVNKDAKCIVHEVVFEKIVPEESPEAPYEPNEVYVPSNTTLSFSDKNASKVVTTATFDVNAYTNNAGSKIRPYEIFGNGMCIQRDAINRIWGASTGASNVAIIFKGNTYYGTVNNNEWEVYLPKLNAGGPYNLTIVTEAGRITLTNVYVGEVFLCSGQSNMEWQPQHAGDVLKDLYSTPECINNQIRMLNVGWNLASAPTTEVSASWSWTGANQATIPYFTAVGYLFGKQMQEELGCPIGLIANPIGGSSIEFWLSEENVNKLPYTPYVDQNNEYNKKVMTPCSGYNGMLYPLEGITLRGVVWYQGCSNTYGTQNYYDIALKIYMNQCREMFDNEQLSFTVCELARYEGNPLAYSIVNEKINEVAANDPYVVVARNLDLGEWYDIHPKDKHEIGRRTAYETLRTFFNVDKPAPITVTGYTFNNDGSVTITLSDDATLVNGTNGFEVYVNGKYTYTCNVTISGNALTVTANGEITKVRYGYTCNMTNEIKNDVSKMVTVYDENGFPLDLFLISKE